MNITIDSSNTGPVDADDGIYLSIEDPGASVTIGNQKIESLLSTVGNVFLQADNDITQLAGAHIDVSGSGGAAGRTLALFAGHDLTLGAGISTNNGGITLNAVNNIDMQDGSFLNAGSAGLQFDGSSMRVTDIATTGNVTFAVGTIQNDGNISTRVRANFLDFNGFSTIGAAGIGNALDTQVNRVSAGAGGSVYIRERQTVSRF